MHHPLAVHVLERGAKLDKIFPDRPLRNQPLLLLKVFDHAGEVASIRELEHDVELVLLDEGGEILDHIWMVELLQQLDLFHAIQSRLIISIKSRNAKDANPVERGNLAIHHLKDLDFLERHRPSIMGSLCPIDNTGNKMIINTSFRYQKALFHLN